MHQALIHAALQARLNAHAPYSNFLVGAAIEAEDGRIITGCNVENATYGLSVCAERVAVFKAVSEGIRNFKAIAISADSKDKMTPPCGACRQIMWEFLGDIPITMVNLEGQIEHLRLSEIFPRPFDASFL